ncbi:MAG TPA: hypothetical protein VF730_10900 [Terracidiphilus sp.]
MKNVGFIQALVGFVPRASVRIAGSIGLGALMMVTSAVAQDANSSAKDQNASKDSYDVHQSWDVGGHLSNLSGSGAMYNTMVNLESGPRVLGQTLEVHALPGAKNAFFDTLFEGSSGYGGDPNDFSSLRMSKGKIYDFNGLFRRDRQYFDYDLLDNPLVPAGVTSNGYTFPQIRFSPHLFNTVRRMTDVDLTLRPVSLFSYRLSYNQNIMQGPTLSSIHQGTEAFLLQNWRNSTDTWLGGIDWKPVHGSTFTFEEHIVHYKGNTSDTLANLGLLQLAGGTPVSIGFDNQAAPSCGNRQPAISNSATNPPTANPTCNGYLQDIRIQPTRTIFPTEEFRLQSSSLKNVQMNGRLLYTSGNSTMPAYYELFNGLESRTSSRVETFTGNSKVRRINTAGNYGIVWQIAPSFSLSEQFDFLNWRQPGTGSLTEVLQTGSSMATAPAAPGEPDTTTANNFLGQKTESNTIVGEWEATEWAQISLGWRYRNRTLGYRLSVPTDVLDGRDYTYNDHLNSTFLNLALRPTKEWKVNGAIETGWADDVYVPVAPRQFQQYQVRTTYKPKDWATISGAYNDLERRDSHVNLLAHNRSFGASASAMPNERFSFDLSYGYQDVFSQVINCFGDTLNSQPADATRLTGTCGNLPSGVALAWLGTSHYNAPTQNALAGIVLTPVKHFQSTLGYRVSSIDGNMEFLNPREVPGTLKSKFQTPYAGLSWKVNHGWAVHGDWNYYGYGEDGLAGPTAPRNFHNNIVTIGLRYEN